MGYRHFDTASCKPRFPFGHGLSYTSFEYSNLKVIANGSAEVPDFAVTLDVKNIGEVFGKESVQLYVRDLESRLPRPFQELKAFDKVSLESGYVGSIEMRLDKHAFKYWDDREGGSWVIEAGDFDIAVGASSTDIRLVHRIRIEKDLQWTGL